MADTTPPTITLSTDLRSLKAGQAATVTFTLSEASADFAASDVTVSGGILSNFKGTGSSYSAIFTPTINSEVATQVTVASGTFSDAAGNKNGDGDDADNSINFLLERIYSVSENMELKVTLPPGTRDISGSSNGPSEILFSLTSTGGRDVDKSVAPLYPLQLDQDGQGSVSFFDLNGVFTAQTSAGEIKVIVKPQPDPVQLVVSVPGVFLGNPRFEGEGRKVVELSDGGYFLVSTSYFNTPTPLGIGLTKLLANGTLDRSFGHSGMSLIPLNLQLFDVAKTENDKLLIAGASNGYGAMVRLQPDGSIDKSFGQDGIVLSPWGVFSGGYMYGVETQSDGKIVAVGRARVLNAGTTNPFGGQYEFDFAIARFNPDGSPDTSFNGKGWSTIQLGGYDIARGVAIQPDGKLIVGGWTSAYGNNDFAAVRLNADGSLDKTFGTSGIVIFSLPNSHEYPLGGVTLSATGKFYLGSGSFKVDESSPGEWVGVIARFNADGSLDTTFGTNGLTEIRFPSITGELVGVSGYDVLERPDGRLVFTGNIQADGYVEDAFAAQLLPDGSLDPSFGQQGVLVTGLGQSIGSLLTTDGGVIFGGYSAGPEWKVDVPAKAKLLSDGHLDESFNPVPKFFPGGTAVSLNHLVSIYDVDSYLGIHEEFESYGGTTLTIQRAGTASVDDRFGSLEPVSFVDTTLDPSDRGLLKVAGVAISQA